MSLKLFSHTWQRNSFFPVLVFLCKLFVKHFANTWQWYGLSSVCVCVCVDVKISGKKLFFWGENYFSNIALVWFIDNKMESFLCWFFNAKYEWNTFRKLNNDMVSLLCDCFDVKMSLKLFSYTRQWNRFFPVLDFLCKVCVKHIPHTSQWLGFSSVCVFWCKDFS